MSTGPRLRAILYARLSVVRESSTSIARQVDDLEALATREGWEIAARFEDEGLSGGSDRANAEEALAMLRDGRADVLAVWKFDRWSRQGLGVVARLIDVLDAREEDANKRRDLSPALFVALSDGLRSDQPAWRIIASVLAEVARMERDATRLRVRSAIRANKLTGRWTGGTAPMGYASAPRADSPGRVLVLADAEADALAEAARMIVGGASVYAATAWLNSTDVRPRRAASWTVQTLSQALTGPAIVGRVTMDGDVLRDDDGLPVDVWPPAIPVDLWHGVRDAILSRRAANKPETGERRRGERSRLLSGIARCASCGAPLYVRRGGSVPARDDRPARPGVAIYSCSAMSNGRKCDGVSITAERLEEYVEAEYLAAVGHYEVVRPVEHEVPAVELVEAERALRTVSERLEDLAIDDDTEAALLSQRRSLRERVRVLRAAGGGTPVKVTFERTGQSYAEVWAASETTGRRALLSASLDVVRVSKGRRGARGLDPARVEIVFPERVDDAGGVSPRGPETDPAKRRLPSVTPPSRRGRV
ncbi:recombinase family protein [Streptomyces sp. ISL-90]|nr:recombinase family protein [Streptomyces sp. ISL-90]